MENLLEHLRENTKSELLRIILTIILVFLILAGVVALASDLGLGEEIARHRVQIWGGILTVSIILVFGYKLFQKIQQIRGYSKRIKELENELCEAKQSEQSLLHLMEKYKRASYSEILEHLKRLTTLVTNRQQWVDTGAQVRRVKIRSSSDANEIDPNFAAMDRIEVIINIGRRHNVLEGMDFLVEDPNIPQVYGLITVKEIFDEGATCVLTEEPTHSFWAQVLKLLNEDQERLVPMQDNRLVPNLPEALDNLTPELAKEFQIIVERIAFDERVGHPNE